MIAAAFETHGLLDKVWHIPITVKHEHHSAMYTVHVAVLLSCEHWLIPLVFPLYLEFEDLTCKFGHMFMENALGHTMSHAVICSQTKVLTDGAEET